MKNWEMKKLVLYATAMMLFAACSSDEQDIPETQEDDRVPVHITTRAEDRNTTGNLQAGLFMVNYVVITVRLQ